MKKTFLTIFGLCALLTMASAQDIQLPQPIRIGGMPLMEALSKRQTDRSFTTENIDNQMLSNLLWAAWGFNREDKRTAPSGNNRQEIDLYVVLESGAYFYDARANKLIQVTTSDIRRSVGKQDFVFTAPVNIVMVADLTKGDGGQTSAYISQNIYLYCASEGLGTVARGHFDANDAHKALNLKENQRAVLTQTVGKIAR